MRIDRTVAYLDDDPSMTQLVAEYLERRGFRVSQLHDACHFLADLPRRRERVLLLDIDMPGMNGLEVLRRVKAFDGGIQVIMVTGVVTMTTVLESLRNGAEACFFKPLVDPGPLAEAVNCCFRKLERWWLALEELSCRRKLDVEAAYEAITTMRQASQFCPAAMLTGACTSLPVAQHGV